MAGTGPDVAQLTPSDCVAALRSYPRRFRATLTDVADDQSADDLAQRAGPDGRSAVDHADDAARSVAMLHESMRRVLVEDSPVLLPAVLDAGLRQWAHEQPWTVESVCDFVAVECDSMADAMGGVDAEAWARDATVAGTGRSVTALDVAREAVRTGAVDLRAAGEAMAAARR